MSEEKKNLQNQNDKGGEQSPQTETEVETLKSKVEELERNVATLKDQFLRKAADFENYKKRVENDFATMARFANEDLIIALLPILDDFSRSLKAIADQNDVDSIRRGIELIYYKFLKVLEAQGVREIESVGKEFDVNYHEAILQIPRDDVAPHTIIEEVEKGYTLHNKVIRHAKVIVAADSRPHEIPIKENKTEESSSVSGELPPGSSEFMKPTNGSQRSLSERLPQKPHSTGQREDD